MHKYDPLSDHLAQLQGDGPWRVRFGQIDRLVGGLPRSARIYREWWDHSARHVQAAAWVDNDLRVVDVDLEAETVTFERA